MTAGRDTIRFDPHVHTEASYDAVGSVDEVLAAADESHLDALAITDHDTVSAARQALAKQDEYDVCIIPGVEVSTAEGHLLALDVKDLPPIGASITETVAWIRSAGGMSVVPHPFQRSRHGVRKHDMPNADGIEIFNAWSIIGVQNYRARLFAADEGYPCLGGSDAHEPWMVGTAYTALFDLRSGNNSPATSDILDALSQGKTAARGRSASINSHIIKYIRSMRVKTRSTIQQTVFGVD